MKTIKIYLHSFVDIITNSSTEIYTNPTEKSVETMYSIIGKLLKVAWIKTDPKELFDVHLEAVYKIPTEEQEDDENLDDYDECEPYIPTKEEEEALRDKYVNDSEYRREVFTLVVKDKTGKNENIVEELQSMFESEEWNQ